MSNETNAAQQPASAEVSAAMPPTPGGPNPGPWAHAGYYQSVKIVQAAQIVAISAKTEEGKITGWSITVQVGTLPSWTIEVADPNLCSRYTANVGDWLLRYGDGYVAVSPRKAFETGYLPWVAPGAKID